MDSSFDGYPHLYHLAHNYTAYVSGYIGKSQVIYNSSSLSIGFAKVNSNGTIYYSTDASVTDPAQFTAYSSGTVTVSGDTTVAMAVKYNGEFGAVTRCRFISLPGGGTESNPYVISQKYQLGLMEDLPTGCFVLANDLTFTDADFASSGICPGGWDPIASFTGSFNGQGHAIYGLKGSRGGLFENIGSGGTVKNLRIIDHRLVGPGRLGAVADSNNGTVSRCYTKSAFTLSDMPSFGSSSQVATVGGVVGYSYGTVEYCRNDGIVYATTTMGSSSPHIGGIVGDGGDIRYCVNTGDLVYGNDYSNNYADYVFMGGIAGLGRVENCKAVQNMYINDGTDYSPYVAGISAWYSTGYADSCVADFTLYKNATFGAGVGQYAYCANTSYNCYNAETAQLPADCEELTFGYGGNWWVSNEGVMPQGVIDPDGHAWSLKSGGQILPNCTAKGDACLECLICGEGSGSVDHLETISALGHRYTSYTSNNDATCQADGTKTAQCDRGCGATETVTDEGSKTDCSFTVVSDTVATAATCKDAAAYYAACATCGTVSNTVTLPVGDPADHSWVAADCDEPKHCENCDATEGEALGHDWQGGSCLIPGTCSVCGETAESAPGHSWVAADCDTPKTCSVCSATEGTALGHTWVAATCTAPKTCSVCSATEGEALGHTWVAADCDTPKTCSVCSATEGDPNGHSWTAADCDTPKTCSVCSATEGAALGHTWVAADCDTPKTCSVCSATEGEALGHSWVDADCENPKHCNRCPATEGTSLGHDWVAADCENPKHCNRCPATEGTSLGHDWVAADCENPKHCSRCPATEGTKLGHDFVDGICSRCEEPDPDYVSFGIVTQPKDVTVKNGETAATTVEARGEGLKYTWYFTSNGTATKFSKSSVTTATYSTTMNTDRDGRKVYCVITDKDGSTVTTETVTLSMEKTPLTLVSQPASVTVRGGETASATVVATGDGLTYTWYYTSNAADTTFSKSSTTTATYSTTMEASRDGRRIYCVITDAYGNSVTTETATLSMEKTPLTIVTQPTPVTVVNGAPAKTTVKAEGDDLTYTWYFTSGGTATKFRKSSVTSATYSTTMNADRDGRQVYCIVTDAYGQTARTETVTLSMKEAIVLVSQPQTAKVGNGETAKVTVEAEGEDLTYTWYYANKGKTTFTKSSYTTNTYATIMDSVRDGRRVYCVIKDQYGNSLKTNTVTMYMYTPLAITAQPADVEVAEGITAKTTVQAQGDGLTYKWYYKNADAADFTVSSIKTATYSTTMDEVRDGRQVYCVITDRYGESVTTDTVTLSMKPRTPLAIVTQPTDVTVAKGETASTTVVATGDGLSYAWYFTSNASDTTFSKSSTTTATYSCEMNADRDGRKVYCKITDAYGNTVKTETVTLSMETAAGSDLTVSNPPASITVGNGKTVSVIVEATGEGLSYQWYYTPNGSSSTFYASSNTTDTYTTTMDSSRDGRKIYCVVTDAKGNSVSTGIVTLNMA